VTRSSTTSSLHSRRPMTLCQAWTQWSDGFVVTPEPRGPSGGPRTRTACSSSSPSPESLAVDVRACRSVLPVFVLHGAPLDRQVESALMSLAPIIRRRAAEERLARTTIQLAQRNEALEDFAALVAHELKTPLATALVADDPSRSVEDAICLVDALLQASRSGSSDEAFASVTECLEQAVDDLHVEIEITADVATTLPLPPVALRVILRNLLSNAVAAGAGHVQVTATRSSVSWCVLVDDDGVGLAAVDRYDAGSGLGLSLCRRIAARFGGALELSARPSGGTRATLTFTEALA